MKRVEATIKAHHLDALKLRLGAVSVHGITVTETFGPGPANRHSNAYRGAQYAVELVPSIHVMIVAAEDQVATIVDAILDTARDSSVENGTITVSPIDEVVRVRTRERGRAALQ